eukprot:11199152-Ditylum_brightwellii.AAC.1
MFPRWIVNIEWGLGEIFGGARSVPCPNWMQCVLLRNCPTPALAEKRLHWISAHQVHPQGFLVES